jgi:hypothetical protein
MRTFHGGDIFLLSLLAHYGVVLMARWPGPWEGSIGGILVGSFFLAAKTFLSDRLN